MTDVLVELGAHIATDQGLTVGTDLYRGFMPPEPAVCVAIMDYPGEASQAEFGNSSGDGLENPRVAVWCRGAKNDRATPRAQAHAIRVLLSKIWADTIGGTLYHWVRPLGSPAVLGRDENTRVTYYVNYRIRKEPS